MFFHSPSPRPPKPSVLCALIPMTNSCHPATYIFSIEAGPRPNLLEQLLDHSGLPNLVVAADDDLHPAPVSNQPIVFIPQSSDVQANTSKPKFSS